VPHAAPPSRRASRTFAALFKTVDNVQNPLAAVQNAPTLFKTAQQLFKTRQ